ncbi:MAG: MarR family transcriptional regulator, partial [Akkermansiaceae bacterium]|nr:MarR family transcriptional regulator [Akkermansiaceae bacterium]
MFSQALRDIARPSYSEILEALKRSDGLPVSDLARELNMSYMGVKQHCVNLEKKGYLETWRVPRTQVGRPEKLYRLTAKTDSLFPQAGAGLTLSILKGVQQLYGESAAEKLLFHHFEEKRNDWAPKVRAGKSLAERATKLADLRESEGSFSKCCYDSRDGLRIEEFHNVLTPIFEAYPNSARTEVIMMEQLLGTRVQRKEMETGKGRKRIVYEVAALGSPGTRNAAGSAANANIR